MSSVSADPLRVLSKYFSLECHEPASEDRELAEIYALRYQVYCLEREFLAALDYPDGLEYDDDDVRSAHFAARNADGVAVGTARLVFNRPGQRFPFEQHCPPFTDFACPAPELAVEVSRLAVSKAYRRRAGDTPDGVNEQEIRERPFTAPPGGTEKRANAPLLVLGLYREMYRYSRAHGIRYWYAAMERSLTRVLAHYGFAFQAIGPESDYYGPVSPYIGDLQSIERDLEHSNPDLLWWFRHGP